MAKEESSPEKPSVEVSLIDSVGRSRLSDVAAGLGEAALDAFLSNGWEKDIPVVGTVVGLAKTGFAIRDVLFIRKVLKFLMSFDSIPEWERLKFAEDLSNSAGGKQKAGASLLLLLDRLDDLEKPELIGRIYVARLKALITQPELERYCMIVDRAFLPDLVDLTHLRPTQRVNPNAAPLLQALGIVTETGVDYGTLDGLGANIWCELNDFGRSFLQIAFGK